VLEKSPITTARVGTERKYVGERGRELVMRRVFEALDPAFGTG
jgi:hypothetical protein